MSTKRNMGKGNLPDKRRSPLKKRFSGISKLGKQREAYGSKFREILNKKWKVFRVSPIYNFSVNKLKFYERKLNEEMSSKRKATSYVGYTSKLTLNKNLRLNDQCAEALQVEIRKDDSQRIYVGYFISWTNTKPNAEFTICLPVLLVEGKGREVSAVHSCLCKIFDCDIQPVTFSFYALITFFVKLLETRRSNIDVTQEQVTMEFKIPECENSDKVKISFFLEPVTIVFAVIMDSLQEKYQGITPIEIILEFYNKILAHVYHIFKMDLMLAELQKIVFPDAFLGSDGQLRVTTDEAVLSTLEVLQRFTPLDSVTII